MSSGIDLPALETAAHQVLFTKYAFIGLYAVFLYDSITTLPAEIEFIWKKSFTFVTALYIMNKYYALCVFSVALASLFSPLFTPEVCGRFSKFLPFAIGMCMTIFPEMVMALRVSALYQRNKYVDASLIAYIIIEWITIMVIYTRPGHHPLPLPPGTHGEPFHLCIDETADSLGNIKPAIFQFMACIFDSVVFFAVLYKTIEGIRRLTRRGGGTMMGLIGAHSLVYFGVIVTSNLLWAMLIIFAPVGLKYSTVLATFMLVCTVINRMTLDLRSFDRRGGWFAATQIGTEFQTGVGTTLGAVGQHTSVSSGAELAELTLNHSMRFGYNSRLDYKKGELSTFETYAPNDEGHPLAFEELEMDSRAVYNSPYND